MAMMREPLVSRVIRAGELMVSGENQAAVRAGFDDRSIRRGMVVAEGDYMACQTWIEGTFAREFTLHRRVP